MQAAAFRISGDMAIMYRCKFFGYQDTSYDHQGRHYYLGCFIEASEDSFLVLLDLFLRCTLCSPGNHGQNVQYTVMFLPHFLKTFRVGNYVRSNVLTVATPVRIG